MEKIILTEEEEKHTKYCEDFCPIHDAITQYNVCNKQIVSCPSEMCEAITECYVLNRRDEKEPHHENYITEW